MSWGQLFESDAVIFCLITILAKTGVDPVGINWANRSSWRGAVAWGLGAAVLGFFALLWIRSVRSN